MEGQVMVSTCNFGTVTMTRISHGRSLESGSKGNCTCGVHVFREKSIMSLRHCSVVDV